MSRIEDTWYRRRGSWTRLLLPLAWLYALAVALRRRAYRRGWLAAVHPGVPVVVVGNVTVGGTGKTPLVAALAQQLRDRGRQPGIVSRGYRGDAAREPVLVDPDTDPGAVGDEPLLLARRTGCPVAVCPRRIEAARRLVADCGGDVVLTDDGLQHYGLARDAEIAVRDTRRGYGNGLLLPAGPLREPLRRLREVDLELVQGGDGDFALAGEWLYPVAGDTGPRALAEFAGTEVHAIAGIGDPERFFSMLRAAGLLPRPRVFPDHHGYHPSDLDFADNVPLLMTEKDAVKCKPFAAAGWWYLPVTARLTAAAQARLDAVFERVLEGG